MGLTAQVARFINETRFEDLPEAAIKKSRDLFIDTIGVGLAGTQELSGRITLKFARDTGGNHDAGVFGGGLQVSAALAAYANAVLSHNMDYDDWLPMGEEKDNWAGNAGHASCVIVPAALALGEKLKSSGQQVLLAYALGIEVYYRIASARSLNNTRVAGAKMGEAIFGCLGATATAAKLLGLDAHQIAMALGIATSNAGGLRHANVRYDANSYLNGKAASAGVEAAMLAKDGFTGNDEILECRMGFFDTHFGQPFDYDKIAASLGKPFYMASPGPGIKPRPGNFPSFAMSQATLELKQKYSIDYKDINEVRISLMPSHLTRDIPEPPTVYMTRFSFNYVCANALIFGKLNRETFSETRMKDPRVKEVIKKIKITEDESLAKSKYAGTNYAPVAIILNDGTEYRHGVEVQRIKGHPMNPLTHDELLAKYRDNAGLVLTTNDIEHSLQLIESMDKASNIGELMSIVSKKAKS